MTTIYRWGKVAAALTLGLTISDAAAIKKAEAADARPSFFITSVGLGKGGDLGGLAGADAHCTALAEAAGIRGRTWKAYLSTDGARPVHARDRIGRGPWYNVRGVQIASSVDDLHRDMNNVNRETALNEKGGMINGRTQQPNQHDILTGSTPEGRLQTPFAPEPPPSAPPGTPHGAKPDNMTCNNWTSSGPNRAMLGHHDRASASPTALSWNSAHASAGCAQSDLVRTGGVGLFYCFAAD